MVDCIRLVGYQRWIIVGYHRSMNFSISARLVFVLIVVALVQRSRAAEPAYAPTSSYSTQSAEGWTIHVSHALSADHGDLCQKTLTLLRVKLYEITRVVPPKPLEKLREVPIWIEYQDRGWPCMCYHPSRDWLKDNGYNPDKAQGVEIAGAQNFLDWATAQPWMVLHELAHSYHDRVLGFDNAEVKAAYQAAVDSHSYDKVLYYDGRQERHYALTDEKEYFAECSEAFFGTNDFFPFVRAELAQHDPRAFHLLEKVWGTSAKGKRTD